MCHIQVEEVQVLLTLHMPLVVQGTSFRKQLAVQEILFSHRPLETLDYAFRHHYKRCLDQGSFFQNSFVSLDRTLRTILDLHPAQLCQVLDPYKDHNNL